MRARGDFHPSTNAPVVDDDLPAAFWEEAEVVEPTGKKSVHLKLDPDVFDFFKRGGKGHLTRMQNVLAAYAAAKRRA